MLDFFPNRYEGGPSREGGHLLWLHSWEEEQRKQVLASWVEEEHPTEVTLMRGTGCAKRAWHRSAWPGAGVQRANREIQPVPESSNGCKLKKGNFWLDVRGGTKKKLRCPSFRTGVCSSWGCSQEEMKPVVASKLRETIVFHLLCIPFNGRTRQGCIGCFCGVYGLFSPPCSLVNSELHFCLPHSLSLMYFFFAPVSGA